MSTVKTERVTLRMPASRYRRVKAIAEQEGISANEWIVRAIQHRLTTDNAVREQYSNLKEGLTGA